MQQKLSSRSFRCKTLVIVSTGTAVCLCIMSPGHYQIPSRWIACLASAYTDLPLTGLGGHQESEQHSAEEV